jgi:hypothetical protein
MIGHGMNLKVKPAYVRGAEQVAFDWPMPKSEKPPRT